MGGFILAPRTVIEEDVFSGPGLTVTDDLTMGRHRGVTELPAVMLRRACRVGSNVTVLPGLEIGEGKSFSWGIDARLASFGGGATTFAVGPRISFKFGYY